MLACGQEFSEKIIRRINQVVRENQNITRSELSRLVCEWLGWRSPNGRFKEMSCRISLKVLEERGFIELNENIGKRPIRLKVSRSNEETISSPYIQCELKDLGKIDLFMVTSRNKTDSRLWNDLLDIHHYLGSGPLCGAQIRYLIKSQKFGDLGALAFSAAALRLNARDEWIGWDETSRKKGLHLVVSNSRFLILPTIKVKNLASHVLALSANRLRQDWQERYGYKPVLLETFVEQGRFSGTSYQAANWIHIGQTAGRGSQDSKHEKKIAVKDVYIFPLVKNPKKFLRRDEDDLITAKPGRANRICADWAEEEFGSANLGDSRLVGRLLTISRDMYAKPQANIPQACGTRSKAKAAYRFFENESTNMDSILKPHYEATTKRMGKEKIALAMQDTTSLNYSSHPMTEGLGLIGSYENGPIGLLVHDTLVFNTEGTPLGLLDVQWWKREDDKFGTKLQRKNLPITEKESNKWMISFKKASDAQRLCPGTTVVSIGDREADVYELFMEANSDKLNARVLVRARDDRRLKDGLLLWTKMAGKSVAGIQEILLPRKQNQERRIARLEVKFSPITLTSSFHKSTRPPQELWAIQARENADPDIKDPIEWMLLTNIPVSTFDQAVEKLRWYTLRWGIEVYHKTIKSGCKIEERQLGSAKSITTCLAIDMVVAWRIFHLTKLGRETPDVPCTTFFAEAEWKALVAFVTKNPHPPPDTPTLRTTLRMVANLGGFLGRKGDGEPGTKSIWLGLQRLDDITITWKVMVDLWKNASVSSNRGYG